MDVTLHVGGREVHQLVGKSVDGSSADLDGSTITEVCADPQLATVTQDPDDSTKLVVDGIAAGRTHATIQVVNADGVPAQDVTLLITVLPADVVEVDVEQIGEEVPIPPLEPAHPIEPGGPTGPTGPTGPAAPGTPSHPIAGKPPMGGVKPPPVLGKPPIAKPSK